MAQKELRPADASSELSGSIDRRPWQRCALPWQSMVIDLTGEVFPCPYYHYSDTGQTVGNTNVNSLDEVWNGPEYRDLRARHVSGNFDGHPCGNCMAYRGMGGSYPAFEWGETFRHEQGHCHIVQIPELFWERNRDRPDQIVLVEDGVPLPLSQSLHKDIRDQGQGRYSVWRGQLYMATPDGSNPACNGRKYELRRGDDSVSIGSLDLNSASARNLVRNYEEYRDGVTTLATQPSKITFIETSDCNIDCPACSQNEVRLTRVRHRPETNPAVLALVPFLQELIWHGGEPYLMPRFRRFVEEFRRDVNPNFTFGFMSNGTMITAQETRKLENFERFNITISVDSFVKETYDRLRAGAKYERVMENLFRLLAMQEWPRRKITVAMIIGKSNFLELAENIRFALEHDIHLMVNPITQYPPTEKLTLFDDFKAQTEGWEAVLSAAEDLLEEASRLDRRSLRNLDPRAAVREIRSIYERHKTEQSDIVELTVELDDPHGSISRMRRPGLMVHDGSGPHRAVAYTELEEGGGAHTLRIPRSQFTGPLRFACYADLLELGAEFNPLNGWINPAEGDRLRRCATVPCYEAPPRPKNIHYMKSKAEIGLELQQRTTMMHAYASLAAQERAAGFGFLEDDVEERTERARKTWRQFLVNYFRPFVSGRHAGA